MNWHDIERSLVPELSTKIPPGRVMTLKAIEAGSQFRQIIWRKDGTIEVSGGELDCSLEDNVAGKQA